MDQKRSIYKVKNDPYEGSVSVGDRLRSIREYLELTQSAAASFFGMGESSWKRLELEDRAPKGDVLAKLVALGFSLDWLIAGEGEMRRQGDPAVMRRLAEIHERLAGEPVPFSAHELAKELWRPALAAELRAIALKPGAHSSQRNWADQLLLHAFGDREADGRLERAESKSLDAVRPLPREASPSSKAPTLDTDLLTMVIDEAESLIEREQLNVRPAEKATLFLALYEIAIQNREQFSVDKFSNVVRLAARARG